MNKIIIATIASAFLAMLFFKRKKQPGLKFQPVQHKPGNSDKHITDVFARAKKHGL